MRVSVANIPFHCDSWHGCIDNEDPLKKIDAKHETVGHTNDSKYQRIQANNLLSMTWNPSSCAKSPRKGRTSAPNTYTSTMCPVVPNRPYSSSTVTEDKHAKSKWPPKAKCQCNMNNDEINQ